MSNMRVWCMEIVPVKPLEKYNFLALPLLSRYLIWGNTIWRNTIFSFGETKQSASFNHSPKEFLSVLCLQWWGILIWDDDKIGNLGDESHAFPANHTKCPKNFSSFLTDASFFPTSQMCHDDRGRQPGRSRLSLSSCQFLMFQLYFSHFDGKIQLRVANW